ncbi:MAG: glutamate synthase [Betaproteobacteria bacterium HGW-Betaproteobacteria-12]|nr:MAG: glutamate synthase [Betaproteobacteria bacterium HGW-Betaproteobacteria-12]
MHISSVIVGALPEQAVDVQGALAALSGVEVHAVADDGRMIVSIESTGDDATLSHFETIRQLPGVLSASLVYHQYETDPDEEA